MKSAASSSGSSTVPSPRASFGPGERKNGTSAPSAAASSCRRASASGSSSVSFASRSAAAASELPPPRPAATGICFSIVTRQRGSRARRRRERLERAADERVVVEARDVELLGGVQLDPVGELERRHQGHDLVLAVVAQRTDDEREVQLRGSLASRSWQRVGKGDELERCELLGANVGRALELLERGEDLVAARKASLGE